MQPSELKTEWNQAVAAADLFGVVTDRLFAERSDQEWKAPWTARAGVGYGVAEDSLTTKVQWSITSTAAEVSTEVECTIRVPNLDHFDVRVHEALALTIATPALIPVARANLLDMVMRLGLPSPELGLIRLPSVQQVLDGEVLFDPVRTEE